MPSTPSPTDSDPAIPDATGRRADVDGADSLVFTRRFDAPVHDVWAAVTESDRLARWIGTWTGEPADGSVQFQMTAEGDGAGPETFEIIACERPLSLAVDVHSDLDQEPWHLALTLVEDDDRAATTLTFAQTVPHAEMAAAVGPGWDYYLDRLVAAETGGDAEALDWEAYALLAEHYLVLFS